MECCHNKTIKNFIFAILGLNFNMKQKTNKSILSRLKISGKGKLIRRAANQSHFNAKDSGKKGLFKHQTKNVKKSDVKLFKQFLPYCK